MRGFVTKTPITADRDGNVPKTINLLKAGSWNTPWHGDFELTGEDLEEMVSNFGEGVGLVVEDSPRAPVNEGHNMGGKATGWMTRLFVEAVNGTAGLFADVDWTPAAEKAIKEKEWAYISPEFNPRGWPWEDPEQEFTFVDNVLTGAALTNIPLFKKLKPITASRIKPQKVKASAAGNGDKTLEGEQPMDLAVIRAKKQEELSEEEKTFLVENKAELTADELKTFGLEEAEEPETPETPAEPETPETPEEPETPAPKIEASAQSHGISASELAQLRADAQAGREAKAELEKTKAEAFVTARIAAGQIKSGEKDKTVNVLLASKGDQRTALEAFMTGLPKHENLGKELGDQGVEASAGAKDELDGKVKLAIKASAAQGKRLSYYDAQAAILTEDTALAARVKEENKED
ncbi:phage protease [Rhodococcus sp. IEGM 1374]|uniref:phage protease n=1 Tax=Rhodococcus sp. IEGM 1374 TaxID=3082221 RepID=UPI0029532DEE|nr:phage protease [Rhodococcus sp. IEGM 1374]MDV7992070.1 phage protease [Rhodococcus sp. IEGM 1374]